MKQLYRLGWLTDLQSSIFWLGRDLFWRLGATTTFLFFSPNARLLCAIRGSLLSLVSLHLLLAFCWLAPQDVARPCWQRLVWEVNHLTCWEGRTPLPPLPTTFHAYIFWVLLYECSALRLKKSLIWLGSPPPSLCLSRHWCHSHAPSVCVAYCKSNGKAWK